MADEFRRVYLDACVYLALIKGEAGRLEIARGLLRDGQEKRFAVVASTLLYAEVCGHGEVRAASDAAHVDRQVSAFFEHGFIQWVESTSVLPVKPGDSRVNSGCVARTLSTSPRQSGLDAMS